MTNEVLPAVERLEQKDWDLARRLVRRAGELGLLGTDVPESLGGVGLDKISSIIVGEAAGRSASFATTFGAQTGLAITPLLCFGTEAQKKKYLGPLVSGEIVGAYAPANRGPFDALGQGQGDEADGNFRISGERWI
jgi:alkylation response protein AidB-like acyl-CoA dehydrogenase